MSEVWKFIGFLINAGMLSLVVGGAFAFGFVTVFRWMSWDPVNITIVNNRGPAPAEQEENAA